MAEIHRLPNEILLRIFAFFSPQELCRHVTGVCQQWHWLADDTSLWTRLDVSDSCITGQQLCQLTKHVSGAIKYLNIARLQDLSDTSVQTVMENCRELVHLDMSGIPNLSSRMIRSALVSCRNLQSLSLSQISTDMFEIMQEIAVNAGFTLKRFSFDGSTLTHTDLNLLFSTQDVTHLSLKEVPVYNSTVDTLLRKYSQTLKVLRLDARFLSDTALCHLASFHHLQSLSLFECGKITQSSFTALKNLENLATLVLRNGQMLPSQALIEFFSTGMLVNLAHLDLTGCAQLCDKGVQAISQMCAGKLKCLCLSWCACVSDEGLTHITSTCTCMVRMELIGLHRLRGIWLPTAVQTMKHLTFVNFQLCQNVRVSTMEEAVKQKPELTILDCYGAKVVHSSQ